MKPSLPWGTEAKTEGNTPNVRSEVEKQLGQNKPTEAKLSIKGVKDSAGDVTPVKRRPKPSTMTKTTLGGKPSEVWLKNGPNTSGSMAFRKKGYSGWS